MLDKIERITDLRSIWPHEAKDFSKWLSYPENLELLSKEISIDISLEELESSVGSFSVDMYGVEECTSRRVIIENQLEDTNHDHLGKIITYASGKNAEVIVWVVKRARDEHRQAVEWLNQHTNDNIGFFLVEIQLWKIGESKPAVKFNVVERPNDWAKNMKVKETLSDTKKQQLEFWQTFIDYSSNHEVFMRNFNLQKAHPQHWYNLALGTSKYHVEMTVNTQKKVITTGLYIPAHKESFEKFKDLKNEIEQFSSLKFDFNEASKSCRIFTTTKADMKSSPDKWIDYFEWYCNTTLLIKEIIKRFDS